MSRSTLHDKRQEAVMARKFSPAQKAAQAKFAAAARAGSGKVGKAAKSKAGGKKG